MLLDLAIAVSDRPVAPDQYRYVETHAWWLGSFGAHQHLTEHRLRQWVPGRTDREWVLEHELTGAQTWLSGTAEQAAAEGFDLRLVAPVGRFRARYGEFRTDGGDTGGSNTGGRDAVADSDGAARNGARFCTPSVPPRRGNWQSPTAEFLERLPREPAALLERLRADNPGSWFGPFTAAVTVLRTALVPADLRAPLYRALTGLPGVAVVEHVLDVDGQDRLALVHDAGRTRTELLIDPVDGQFAGERDTLRTDSRCGLPAGTVISTTAVRTDVVDTTDERPAP